MIMIGALEINQFCILNPKLWL